METEVHIDINSDDLDEMIEKAKRLAELLREAQQIANSLAKKEECAYLGCEKDGIYLDDVETSPGVIEKKYVCKSHLGKLNQNVVATSAFSLPCRF